MLEVNLYYGVHVASLICVLPFASPCLLCYIYSVFWFCFYKPELFSLGNNSYLVVGDSFSC